MRSSLICTALSVLVSLASPTAQGAGSTRLTGRVQDPASDGIPGATIRLLSLDRALQTKPNADGSFEFDDVPAGVYDMEIAADGFRRQKRQIDLRDGAVAQPLLITLELGSMPDMGTCGAHSTLKYNPAAPGLPRLTGSIRDVYSGKPVGNAKVTLRPAGERHVAVEIRSDKSGGFRIQDLPAGFYDVRISSAEYMQDIKQLLVPRENGVSIETTVLQRGKVVLCQ